MSATKTESTLAYGLDLARGLEMKVSHESGAQSDSTCLLTLSSDLRCISCGVNRVHGCPTSLDCGSSDYFSLAWERHTSCSQRQHSLSLQGISHDHIYTFVMLNSLSVRAIPGETSASSEQSGKHVFLPGRKPAIHTAWLAE
jgi:hypothetical protein